MEEVIVTTNHCYNKRNTCETTLLSRGALIWQRTTVLNQLSGFDSQQGRPLTSRADEIAIRGLRKYVQEDEICLPFREERIERRISMQYTEATERGRHGRYPI